MYFSDTPIHPDLISVLELEWEQQNLHSGDRPYHALSFRIKGNGQMHTANRSITVKTGDILLVPAGHPYQQISNQENLIVAHFYTDTPLPPKISKFTPKDPPYYESKFRDLLSAWNKRAPGYEYECSSIFSRILFKIEQEAAASGNRSDDLIQEIRDFISDHFTDSDLSLESLTRQYGMSGTYLRRRFSEKYGLSPKRYIQESRLRLAKDLLATDYYTIEQVAERCGFANVHYFSTFIKNETALPPSRLRTK